MALNAHKSGFVRFSWCGEPIPDIKAWARERGEQMVRVLETRKGIVMGCPHIVTEVTEIVMPVSFWNGTARAEGVAGASIYREEIERFDP